MADTGRDEEFYYLLTEGSELLQGGKVDDARKHFERALEMNPTHEQALNLLGLSLFRLNQLDRARQIFHDLVHNNPIEPSLRLNLAMVHLKIGRLDEAKIELERVLELSPDHPRASSYMGLVLERKGELDKAADFYEKAGNKKRADEIRAFRPSATGTFPMPNLRSMVTTPPTVAPGPAAMAAQAPLSGAALGTGGALSQPPSAPRPLGMVSSVPAPVGPGQTQPPTSAPPHVTVMAADRPSAQAEAAALTAATASQLKKVTDPPAAATVESARGASLGFTLEVDERARSKGASPAAVSSLPQSAPAASAPPAATPPAAAGAVPATDTNGLLEEKLSDLAAAGIAGDVPSRRGDDGVLVFPVPDVGYVRTDSVVALSGQFEIEPVNRRYRGKRTDSLFGGQEAPLVALLGKGTAFLAPGKLTLRHLVLKNEELYLVEGSLLAFSQGLVWENGRLPSESDRDLDIVHLRGTGRVILGTQAPLLVLPVRAEQPATVHATRLVGWNGQLVPYRAPLPGLPDAAKRVPVVRFEGTGFVLAL